MTPDDQLAQFSGGTDDLAMSGLWYSHARVTQIVEAARLAAVQECRDRDMTEADVRARLTDAENTLARVGDLAEWFEAQPNWREWGVHRQIRAALGGKP